MTKLNVLIPMAGRGERFSTQGFNVPKPLIRINGKTMVELAIETLGFHGLQTQYTFITRKYQHETFNDELKAVLNLAALGCIQIEIDYVTEGPACTALLAKEHIKNETPLVICNCDQIMRWDGKFFLTSCLNSDNDGVIVTYDETTPKNSYAEVSNLGKVKRIAEKQVISNISLNGIHFWKCGKDFVASAEEMIAANERYNNEFYVGPTYNYMIKAGKQVGIFHIPKQYHHPVGVPEDLKKFLVTT